MGCNFRVPSSCCFRAKRREGDFLPSFRRNDLSRRRCSFSRSRKRERDSDILAGSSICGSCTRHICGLNTCNGNDCTAYLEKHGQNGRILIDGLDIAKVELYSLRRQIGVVPQDSLLFDGTIKDNLLMVKPDASSEELIRAAKIACAHEFIMEQPQGYNSPVGERGAGLSGGQRQRMALARAVLQNPRLLILDEATSALDARTERQVCLNLFDAFRGRTVFFITHRLATVQPADMIVLMDQGAVMEVGDHAELMQRQGWYYGLHQSQHQEGVS